MKYQLREIREFLRNPSRFLVERSVFSTRRGLLYAYANEILLLFIFLLLYVVVSVVGDFIGLGRWRSIFDSFPVHLKSKVDFSIEVFLLLVWAPLFEETLFRGFLSLKKEYVWVSGLFLVFGIQMIVHPILPGRKSIESVSYLLLFLSVYAAIGICAAEIFEKATNQFIDRFLRPNFNRCVYLSMIGFGLAHVINFEVTNSWQYFLAPLLTLPQLVSSVFLCFVRVNYGLVFSVALHFLGNFFTVLVRLPSEFDRPELAVLILIGIAYFVRKVWKQSNRLAEKLARLDL